MSSINDIQASAAYQITGQHLSLSQKLVTQQLVRSVAAPGRRGSQVITGQNTHKKPGHQMHFSSKK